MSSKRQDNNPQQIRQQRRKHNKIVGLVDVAKLAGTSTATVSRFYNSPDIVSDAVGKRIANAANELNYVRNLAASATRGLLSGKVGMVIPTIDNAIFAELIESFSSQLTKHGINLLLTPNNYDLALERDIVTSFVEQRVDGVVLIGGEHHPRIFEQLATHDIPVLLAWSYSVSNDLQVIPRIGVDNIEVGQLIAEHITSLGHKDIAVICGDIERNDRARDRRDGIIQALKTADIEVPDQWNLQMNYNLAEVKAQVILLLQQPNRPMAIIAGNDTIAQATIWAAQSIGLTVPKNLSVIGVGDFHGSAEMHPALTTVRIPAKRIGHTAADMLFHMIQNPDNVPSSVKITPEFKLRESTIAANASSL